MVLINNIFLNIFHIHDLISHIVNIHIISFNNNYYITGIHKCPVEFIIWLHLHNMIIGNE